MAPKLSAAKHKILRRLITNGLLTDEEIAKGIPCSTRSIEYARANLRRFGTTTAPRNPGGRPRLFDSSTANALLERLAEEDDLNLNEQAHFPWQRDGVKHGEGQSSTCDSLSREIVTIVSGRIQKRRRWMSAEEGCSLCHDEHKSWRADTVLYRSDEEHCLALQSRQDPSSVRVMTDARKVAMTHTDMEAVVTLIPVHAANASEGGGAQEAGPILASIANSLVLLPLGVSIWISQATIPSGHAGGTGQDVDAVVQIP